MEATVWSASALGMRCDEFGHRTVFLTHPQRAMASNNSAISSSSPSRSYTASSISSGLEDSNVVWNTYDTTPRQQRNSHSSEKKFSIDGYAQREDLDATAHDNEVLDDSPGTLPNAVYDAQMSWWRASFRRLLIRSLEHESRALGYIQVCFLFRRLLFTWLMENVFQPAKSPD